MTEPQIPLPASVKHLAIDGKDYYLVGTAHVSKESVTDVRQTVEAVDPDAVCVELCKGRYNSMVNRDSWKKMNIFKVIKEKKSALLLAQLIMSGFYRRLGDKLGVEPGTEMLEGIKAAEELEANLVLADRDIAITLKRVWGYLGFWNKMKLFYAVLSSLFVEEEIDSELIESIKSHDQLESMMGEFGQKFPTIKERLITERDVYLSQMIRRAEGNTVVAVVGAAHIPGIEHYITKDIPLEPLNELPPKSILPKILKWAIPALIIALIAWGFYNGGQEVGTRMAVAWILANGILSAIGAIAALGHPITVVSAFLAAPITSLFPTIAAGWVAGLVQACIKKPTVADFEDIPNSLMTIKGFWTNTAIRILLVTAFANLGSFVGSILGAWLVGAEAI